MGASRNTGRSWGRRTSKRRGEGLLRRVGRGKSTGREVVGSGSHGASKSVDDENTKQQTTGHTMTIDIQSAPGSIKWFKPTASSTRGATEGDGPPSRLTSIDILLDLSDATFAGARDRIVPGIDAVVDALALTGRSQGVEAKSHASLAPVTVRVQVNGELVLDAIGVRVAGKPMLRVSAKGDRVSMPLRVVCPMTTEMLSTLNDHLGVDVTVTAMTTQLDLEDMASDITSAAARPKKTRSKKIRIVV